MADLPEDYSLGQTGHVEAHEATNIRVNQLTRWLPAVSPKVFGAVGGGVVDDSTAMQAAFGSGRPIMIDDAYLAGGLTIPGPTTLYGSRGGKLIRPSAATYTISGNPGSGGSSDPATNISGVTIIGVTFDDNVASLGFRQGDAQLNFNAMSDVLIDGCTFLGPRSDALYIGSSNTPATERHNRRFKVINCTFDGVNRNQRNAISVIDCDDLTISDCTFRRFTRSDMPSPIDIEANSGNTFAVLRNFTIEDNTFDDIGGSACIGTLLADASTYTTLPGNWKIAGNTFRNVQSGNAPINLSFAGNATTSFGRMGIDVINNTFVGVPRFARFDGIRGVRFAGNTIAGSTGAGMIGSSYTCLDLVVDRNEFFQVGPGDGGAPAALNLVNGQFVKIDGNTFIDCGLVDGTWGMCLVMGGPGASDYVDFVGTNTMRAGTRMTDVVYKSSSHTKGTHNTYTAPIGATGGTALP